MVFRQERPNSLFPLTMGEGFCQEHRVLERRSHSGCVGTVSGKSPSWRLLPSWNTGSSGAPCQLSRMGPRGVPRSKSVEDKSGVSFILFFSVS